MKIRTTKLTWSSPKIFQKRSYCWENTRSYSLIAVPQRAALHFARSVISRQFWICQIHLNHKSSYHTRVTGDWFVSWLLWEQRHPSKHWVEEQLVAYPGENPLPCRRWRRAHWSTNYIICFLLGILVLVSRGALQTRNSTSERKFRTLGKMNLAILADSRLDATYNSFKPITVLN